jgi:hypothetical protein
MNDNISWVTFGKDRYHQNHEMRDWCKEHIGHGGWTGDMPKTWEGISWAMYGMFGNITYAFNDPKHLTAFILRWS